MWWWHMQYPVSSLLANETAVSSPLANETGFSTLADAAVAGLQASVHRTTKTEVAGAVYELDNKFYYTNPASNASEDSFQIAISFPTSSKLVAIFHTHPASFPNNYLFSPGDIKVADQLHLISFVAVLSDNGYRIIEYIPGQTDTEPMTLISDSNTDTSLRVSYGFLVMQAINKTAAVCHIPEYTIRQECP